MVLGPLQPQQLSHAGSSRPNILLLMPDQWRWDWDGAHEAALRMPHLAALRASGTSFPQGATVPSPLCAPSRACMVSLREYDEAGVPDNHLNDYPAEEIPTYFSSLKAAGYHTMAAGKDDLTKHSRLGWRLGKNIESASGTYLADTLGFSDSRRYLGKIDVVSKYPEPSDPFGYYLKSKHVKLGNGTTVNAFDAHAACLGVVGTDPKLCKDASSYPQELYEDDWTAAQAVELLEHAPDDKPWFIWVSFPGPHDPFDVTGKMTSMSVGRSWPSSVDPTKSEATTTQGGSPSNKPSRANYAAEVENLDRLFGVVLDAAGARGHTTLTDLVVCVFSDHGDMLYDHGEIGKEKPWQGSLNVPLVCAGPGIRGGLSLNVPVASVDLGATVLDIAGADQVAGMTALSFRGLLEGADPEERNRTVLLSGLQTAHFGAATSSELRVSNETWRNETWRLAEKEREQLRRKGKISVGKASYSWRAAVMGDAKTGAVYKFVCCQGECPGAPSTAGEPDADGYMRLLYNTAVDPIDMVDLKKTLPHVAAKLQAALPRKNGFDCS